MNKDKNTSNKNPVKGKLALALAIAVAFASGTTFGSTASNHTFKSTGNVAYNSKDNAVFNKEDLSYLDNRIDTLEQDVDSYKTTISNQINTWDIPDNEKLSSTSTFDEINKTLEYIKSVPNENGTMTDSSGNTVYVKTDGSITTTSSDGVSAVTLTPATSSNLSAGYVAWSKGSLIVGTGADNKTYYDNGSSKSTKTVTAEIIVVDANQFGDKSVSFSVNGQYIGGCTIVKTNPYGLPGGVSKTLTIK